MAMHRSTKDRGAEAHQTQVRYILGETRLGADPGYYAGRSASLGDVDGAILTQLRRGIEAFIGPQSAEHFDRLIEGMSYLSASNVISGVLRLASDDWNYRATVHEGGRDRTGRHAGSESQAFAVLAAAMFGTGSFGDRDETEKIKEHYKRIKALNPEPATRQNWKDVDSVSAEF